MANLTPEERRIVEWLRAKRGREFTVKERLLNAWWSIVYGELLYFAVRIGAANAIERGDHRK